MISKTVQWLRNTIPQIVYHSVELVYENSLKVLSIETKERAKQWTHKSSPRSKKAKTVLSARKVMVRYSAQLQVRDLLEVLLLFC